MIKYQVRSRDLLDMANDIKSGRLILSPYFQRNLVWRELHKQDFIETILKGYPFPQIFVARGDINVDTMTSYSCVVDGQQRMNAIKEFIADAFPVGGRKFSQLDGDEKEQFLTYQIPVIDLDIKATDPSIIDIFKRLNRTFYALSTIEKMATEYATVDFMLIAKFLCDLLVEKDTTEDDIDLTIDPNMPKDFFNWTHRYDVSSFREFIFDERLFSTYETSRLVHLMYTLNIIATVNNGMFARNETTREILDSKTDYLPNRDVIISRMNKVASYFMLMNFDQKSMWWNKANVFSLFVVLFWNFDAVSSRPPEKTRDSLIDLEANLPGDYALAAREAVNNRKQRIERHQVLSAALGLPLEENPLNPI